MITVTARRSKYVTPTWDAKEPKQEQPPERSPDEVWQWETHTSLQIWIVDIYKPLQNRLNEVVGLVKVWSLVWRMHLSQELRFQVSSAFAIGLSWYCRIIWNDRCGSSNSLQFPARNRSPQPQKQLKWKRKQHKRAETKSQAGLQLYPIYPYESCMYKYQ